jgi:hypothetical protein
MRLRLSPNSTRVALLFTTFAVSACGDQNALLLTLSAESLVESFDLRVRDLSSQQIVLERKEEPVDPSDPNRDISQPGKALKLSIEFSRGGHYLLHILGSSGSRFQVALRDFQITGSREESIKLRTLPAADDQDGDGFPACGTYGNCTLVGNSISCRYLDCDDNDASVHPFGTEVCGNGKDDDCDQGCGADPQTGDSECVDNDGDGVPAPLDCDDDDPCRTPSIKEAQNMCGSTADDFKLPQACLDKLAKEGVTPPTAPFCGDGIDQNCSGGDEPCVVDADCDGFSPPDDCDDQNDKINPSAAEECDGIDNNCNKVTDEGCIPCDVDGDGHAHPSATGAACTVPKDDPDDFDAGVNPSVSAESQGKEGGTVLGALRRFCSDDLTKDGVTKQIDVDHDGDGNPASADGCPRRACDKDGDGYMVKDVGQGCNPPVAEEDCDDEDPKTFPGAPDYCGDGKAQNCIADRSCGSDADGDRYLTPDDCDDADPNVHPWATEICDRKDNDCDGLINEGNPNSSTGALIPSTPSCTDDNDGKCAEKKGVCACSLQLPTSVRDDSNRTACVDEDLSPSSASPRCFGAAQPKPEECDTSDWDCNGQNDDPTGQNLADKGKACGVTVGSSCVAGTVVGCDLTKTVPNLALVQAVQPDFNPNWICSSGTRLAIPEVCNGKDDDCDGSIPVQEQDPDTDGYIECTGCTTGSGRTDLASTLTGCGDCAANQIAINPGALEACNNVDDNCQSGVTDDGADECTAGQSCCSLQKACRNLQTDSNNCGDCGRRCNTADVDRCVGGNCVCGNTGGPCPAGLDCVGGSCQCIVGGRCNGCCQGGSCYTVGGSQNSGRCGSGGNACGSCDDSNPCTSNVCNSSGQCSNPNRPDITTTCTGGVCLGGQCCTTCRNGTTCRPSSQLNVSNCGSGGAPCQDCDDSDPCTTQACNSGSCSYGSVPNSPATACTNGQCFNGSCCTGCISGGACVAGDQTSACGRGGGACSPCGSTECTNPTCSNGTCGQTPVAAGTGCTNGRCYAGSCCPGCWNSLQSRCELGTSDPARCGTGGGLCTSCPSPANDCEQRTCNAGSCGTSTRSDGSGCSGGLCYGGTCCTGCWNATGSTCVLFGSQNPSTCGSGGANCSSCPAPAAVCQVADCASGSCGQTAAADTTSCTVGPDSGQCRSGSCCVLGCWDSGSTTCRAYSSQDENRCGDGGNSCATCPDPGECLTASCSLGACGSTPAADTTSCQSGAGQCWDGGCCTGCWNATGSVCEGGTDDALCGSGGAACVDCTATAETCQAGGTCGT